MKKTFFIVAAVSCMVGFIFVFNSTNAINYYNTDSASKDEQAMYNISKESSESRDDEYEYDPTEIDNDIIESKAEAISDATGENADVIEENMKKHALETRVLYLAALDAGYTVSDAELDDAIDNLKTIIKSDPDESANFKAILAGEGCSENEYWEMVRPQYEAMMLNNKYLDDQIAQLMKERGYPDDPDEYQNAYHKYADEIIQAAINKYGDNSDG